MPTLPTFQNTLSIGDVINALIFLGALAAFIISIIQIRSGASTQRANFFKDLYQSLYEDDTVMAGFYLIEKDGGFTYDPATWPGSPAEKVIDRLLFCADLICALYEQRRLTNHEMQYFRYAFSTVYNHPEIRKYLDHLDTGAFRNIPGPKVKAFPSFQAYCRDNFDKEPSIVRRLMRLLPFTS